MTITTKFDFTQTIYNEKDLVKKVDLFRRHFPGSNWKRFWNQFGDGRIETLKYAKKALPIRKKN